jgi:hypothetical protein
MKPLRSLFSYTITLFKALHTIAPNASPTYDSLFPAPLCSSLYGRGRKPPKYCIKFNFYLFFKFDEKERVTITNEPTQKPSRLYTYRF